MCLAPNPPHAAGGKATGGRVKEPIVTERSDLRAHNKNQVDGHIRDGLVTGNAALRLANGEERAVAGRGGAAAQSPDADVLADAGAPAVRPSSECSAAGLAAIIFIASATNKRHHHHHCRGLCQRQRSRALIMLDRLAVRRLVSKRWCSQGSRPTRTSRGSRQHTPRHSTPSARRRPCSSLGSLMCSSRCHRSRRRPP